MKKSLTGLNLSITVFILLFVKVHSQLNISFATQDLVLPFSSETATYNFSISSNNKRITFVAYKNGSRIDCSLETTTSKYQGCEVAEVWDVIYAENIWYGEKDYNYVGHGALTYISTVAIGWSGLYPLTVSFGGGDTYYAMQSSTRCSMITDYQPGIPANWNTINSTLSCEITSDGYTLLIANSTGVQVRVVKDKYLGYQDVIQNNFSSPNTLFSNYGVSAISSDGNTIATSYTLANNTYSLVALWKKGSFHYESTGQTLLIQDSCPLKSIKFSRDSLKLLASTGNKYEYYTRESTSSKFVLGKSEIFPQSGNNLESSCNNSLAKMSQDGLVFGYVVNNASGSPIPTVKLTFATVYEKVIPPDPTIPFKILTGVGFGLSFILILVVVCISIKFKRLKQSLYQQAADRVDATYNNGHTIQPPSLQNT